MTTKLNFRSVIFKRAYIIVKETKCSFSEALKQAWKRYRDYKDKVVSELSERINNFDFYYDYSDDGRVYRYWSGLRREIREQLQSFPCSFVSAISGQLSQPSNIKTFI